MITRTIALFTLLITTTLATSAEQYGTSVLNYTTIDLIGEEMAIRVAEIIPLNEELSWQIYIPKNFSADKPPGLMVYISPTQSGELPRGWDSVMDEKNLIWIAAEKSGNREIVGRRTILAILAPTLIEKNFEIDKERIYVSGLSGGGKMASLVATDYPHLFKGAIYNCGVDFWSTDKPVRTDLIQQNRYVFITGTLDQALEPTKRVHRQYHDAGIENARLMIIPEMTHRNPNRFKFAEAVQFLDERPGSK